MLKDPLLAPAVALASGIWLSRLLQLSWSESTLGFLVCLGAACWSRYKAAYVALSFGFLGATTERIHRPGPPPQLDAGAGELVILSGCVVEPPVFRPEREQFVLELEPEARVLVSRYYREGERPVEPAYGERVEVHARVRKPRNFQNPGAFDYAGYLARRHIYWTATAAGESWLRRLEGRCGNPLAEKLYAARAFLLRRLDSLFAGDAFASAAARALVVGDSSQLEKAWIEGFRRTGTYHALVISGLHVTLLAGAAVFVFRLLGVRRATARLAAAGAVWLYAGICGWSAPVVRAAGGFTLYAIGGWFYRRARLLNLLAALSIVFLLWEPDWIVEPSFQMTFLSVLALGALAKPALEATTQPLRRGLSELTETDKDLHLAPRQAQLRIELRLAAETFKWLLGAPYRLNLALLRTAVATGCWIWESMLISAAVQLGLLLPMIAYFHRVSISGLTANLVATPLLTLAVPLGALAAIAGSSWLAAAAKAVLTLAHRIVLWHAGWEPAFRVPDPPFWAAAAFAASLVLLALTRRWWAAVLVAASLVVVIGWPFGPPAQPGLLEVTMLDVGQGESLLVGLPDGNWILVDGGGIPVFKGRPKPRLDIGEDVVSQYLFSRSIRRLYAVVSTHQHDDHASGLLAVIENFRPKELWAGAAPPSAAWSELMAAARRVGAAVRTLRQGDAFSLGQARLDILAPSADYAPRSTPSNNDSLVIRLRFGRYCFLMTGDIERTVENLVGELSGPCDVLKVAHHGSRSSTSEAFLDATRPAFALISAGRDNLFRHPHPEVINRLERRRIATFRTDEWGLVTLRSDGRRLSVETFRWQKGIWRRPPF